jgi:hypothetical protein
MLTFHWNALKVGHRVIVHDDLRPDFDLSPGTVRLVESRTRAANDVWIELDGHGSRAVRPRRQAVHLVPHDERSACWRCDVVTAAATRTDAMSPITT